MLFFRYYAVNYTEIFWLLLLLLFVKFLYEFMHSSQVLSIELIWNRKKKKHFVHFRRSDFYMFSNSFKKLFVLFIFSVCFDLLIIGSCEYLLICCTKCMRSVIIRENRGNKKNKKSSIVWCAQYTSKLLQKEWFIYFHCFFFTNLNG